MVRYYVDHGQHEDAMLVSQTACEGNSPAESLAKSVRGIEIPKENQNGMTLPKKGDIQWVKKHFAALSQSKIFQHQNVNAGEWRKVKKPLQLNIGEMARHRSMELCICYIWFVHLSIISNIWNAPVNQVSSMTEAGIPFFLLMQVLTGVL